MTPCRFFSSSKPTISWIWVSNPTSGESSDARSARPVRGGACTSWPAASKKGMTFCQHQPPCHAPCTSTNVAIGFPSEKGMQGLAAERTSSAAAAACNNWAPTRTGRAAAVGCSDLLGGRFFVPNGDQPERLAETAVTRRLLDFHHFDAGVVPQPGVDLLLQGLGVAAGEREQPPRPT